MTTQKCHSFRLYFIQLRTWHPDRIPSRSIPPLLWVLCQHRTQNRFTWLAFFNWQLLVDLRYRRVIGEIMEVCTTNSCPSNGWLIIRESAIYFTPRPSYTDSTLGFHSRVSGYRSGLVGLPKSRQSSLDFVYRAKLD